MKLLHLLIVVFITAFAANCHELPQEQRQVEAFEERDHLHPPTISNQESTGEQLYIQNKAEDTDQTVKDEEYQQLYQDVKRENGIELRGKGNKNVCKKLVDSLRMGLQIINKLQDNITDSNIALKNWIQNVADHQINITDSNANIEKKLENISDSNSQLKIDVSSLKQSMANSTSLLLTMLKSVLANQGCVGAGMFKIGNECFKVLSDKTRNWQDANTACTSLHLILAEPEDKNAAPLRKYMVEKYGDYQCWVGARGDGSKLVWQTSKKYLTKDSTLLDGGRGSSSAVSTSNCLELDVLKSQLSANPTKPYDAGIGCTTLRWALCEVH